MATLRPRNEPKVRRAREEIFGKLQEQMGLLVHYCAEYDAGRFEFATPMVSTLRALLHRNVRNGSALLEGTDAFDAAWFDFSIAFPVHQAINTCLLAGSAVHDRGAFSTPHLWPVFGSRKPDLLFADWWSTPVANSARFGSYARGDFVLAMGDMDASHVDRLLTESYAALRDGTFLSNLTYSIGSGPALPIPGLNHAGIRTIAHETILTVHRVNRTAFPARYFWRPVPHAKERMCTKLPGEA